MYFWLHFYLLHFLGFCQGRGHGMTEINSVGAYNYHQQGPIGVSRPSMGGPHGVSLPELKKSTHFKTCKKSLCTKKKMRHFPVHCSWYTL